MKAVFLIVLLHFGGWGSPFMFEGSRDVVKLQNMVYCPTNKVKEGLELNVPPKKTCDTLLKANEAKTFKADVSFVGCCFVS